MKLYKGQKVISGGQEGYVIRMFGAHAVQVATIREKLMLEGFPARPVGTQRVQVKETWPVSRITLADITPIGRCEDAPCCGCCS